jgi:2-keto-3-deoxy-galactonokinase
LSSEECYWQLIGVLIGDMLPSIVERIRTSANDCTAIVGYPPLAEAWSASLKSAGLESRILTERETEQAFCTGVIRIVEASLQADPESISDECGS